MENGNAVLLPYFRNSTAKIRAKIEIPSAVKQKYRFKIYVLSFLHKNSWFCPKSYLFYSWPPETTSSRQWFLEALSFLFSGLTAQSSYHLWWYYLTQAAYCHLSQSRIFIYCVSITAHRFNIPKWQCLSLWLWLFFLKTLRCPGFIAFKTISIQHVTFLHLPELRRLWL